jgi:CARDB protein
MPLRAAILALVSLALLTPAAGAAVPKWAAKAVLSDCERGTGEDTTGRSAEFEGQMRAVRGAARMQMRFTLQARTPDSARWSAVSAPGFGVWVSSAAGTSRYVYTKRVEGLLAPAEYRVQLRFRWLSSLGRTLASARRTSRSCRQPDPRPDLVVSSLTVRRAVAPNRYRYVAFVRNTGRSAAGPSQLRVAFGATVLPFAPVAALEPGEGIEVAVEGPACATEQPVDADADAGEAIDERDEADNRFTRLCPPPS